MVTHALPIMCNSLLHQNNEVLHINKYYPKCGSGDSQFYLTGAENDISGYSKL